MRPVDRKHALPTWIFLAVAGLFATGCTTTTTQSFNVVKNSRVEAGYVAADGGWDSEWLYFSFVSMTTLGYGDILPISATARALAYMQAVYGQFYVAVLVAGLVSTYISERNS